MERVRSSANPVGPGPGRGLAPVVDIMLLYGLVFWELSATMVTWGLMLALQLFTAAVAFRFDNESMRPLWRLFRFAYLDGPSALLVYGEVLAFLL